MLFRSALVEYSNDDTEMSLLNCTFKDLLVPIWTRIQKNENHKDEIKKILNNDMKDSLCKCFTGRISRLLNVLNGFYDDVNVTINSSEQIGNIIVIVKERLESENRYSIELHKDVVRKELIERNYPEETIEEWLNEV